MTLRRCEKYTKVLCVCTAGMLRSPTMAWVLSNPPYDYDTRSCGIDDWCALIPLTQSLLVWADLVVCAEQEHKEQVKIQLKKYLLERPMAEFKYGKS